jgi:uncharacterized protein YdeI (YjbR/CyaY-like superfamily)
MESSKPLPSAHAKVDEYIASAPPFAQPILTHLRELIHKACPGAKETIKWSRPFFEHQGVILCNMAAFKEHCSFSFWSGGNALRRITSLTDLPPDKTLLAWIRQAQNTSPSKRPSVVKPPPAPPAEFTAALRKHQRAKAAFAALSPSCQREYIEWIAGAKRPETRDKRMATALEWIEQGKQRHWKYQGAG